MEEEARIPMKRYKELEECWKAKGEIRPLIKEYREGGFMGYTKTMEHYEYIGKDEALKLLSDQLEERTGEAVIDKKAMISLNDQIDNLQSSYDIAIKRIEEIKSKSFISKLFGRII